MLFERRSGARVLKRWMQKSLFYWNVIWILNYGLYRMKIGEEKFELSGP